MKKKLVYFPRGKMLILLLTFMSFVSNIQAQNHEVGGQVLDENQEPLPGATVVIKGTTKGVITDMNGKYNITCKNDDILQVSFIGFVSQDLNVDNRTLINVSLKSAISKLEDITVVGFGTQKKDAVVGSMSTIKPSELKMPTSNLTTALAGRMAGVISYQNSGEPGQDNAQFFVRGITTFAQGASPLILIDGIELTTDDLARLNPDDIESFSVFKDATSTAVYGARGANGVIYVVTKSGAEGPTKINARYETSFSQNTSMPSFADGVMYMKKYNEAVRTRFPGTPVPFSEEKIYNTENNVNSMIFPNVDWQDQMIRDVTHNQRFNLNLRGGGRKVQFYLAGNFSQDHGIMKDDPLGYIENNINLKRYGIRANVNAKLSKTTDAVLRVNSTYDDFTGPSVGSAVLFSQTLLTNPVRFPAVYHPDKKNVNTPHILFGNEKLGENTFYVNPYHQLVSGYTEKSRALNLVQLELKQDLSMLTEGLSLRFVGNLNRTSNYALARNSDPFFYQAKLEDYQPITNEYVLTRLNDDGNRALTFQNLGSEVKSSKYGELSMNYERSWGEHTLNAMTVGIIRASNSSSANTLVSSLPFRNVGVSGRLTYDYQTKYFAEFNFGYNGSERFAAKNRFGFFPSFGLGWLMSKENFMQNVNPNLISRLKLKASYGIVGNDNLGYTTDRFFYQSQVNISAPGFTWGDYQNRRNVKGVSIKNYENTNITWEKAKTLNIGVEWNFLQDAFQFRADYFNQKRTNILQQRLLALNQGLQAYNRDNVGEAETSGIDLSIDGNKSFLNGTWVSVRGTFTYSSGKITHFEEPNYALLNSPHRTITGGKIGQTYGYIAERLFYDDIEVANSPEQNFGGLKPQAGDIKYKDINGDNVINDLDRVPIGNPTTPSISYGMGASFGVKNFDFSIFFQGNAKVSFLIDPAATAPFITGTRKVDQAIVGNAKKRYYFERALLEEYAKNHWSEENRDVNALYPRLTSQKMPNNEQTSTWWLRDGSFLRLKQIEIGYNIRPKEKFGVDLIRIYATGTNLAVWSKFKMWDPELRGNGFGYPLQRVYNLGVSVNF